MQKTITLLNKPTTLLFDIGTQWNYAEMVDKNPVPTGSIEEFVKAQNILVASYFRYHAFVKLPPDLTEEEVRHGFLSMNYDEVLDMVKEFWMVLTVKPNPEIQKILDAADKLEGGKKKGRQPVKKQ